jgi:hypothetical protein
VDRKGKETALKRLQNNIVGERIAQNENKITAETTEKERLRKKEETVHFLSIFLHKTGMMLEEKQEGGVQAPIF